MDMRTLIALLMWIGALETQAQLITRAALVPLSNYVAEVQTFGFNASNYFASLGSGTNHLVQTNGVTVGSAGTVNWTAGVTGHVSSGVLHLGVSAAGGGGGGDVTTSQLNAASNVLRTDITALQGATNGLHTRAGNLEGATNGLRTDVLNLQGATNGLGTRVGNVEGATNGLTTRAGNLEGATNGLTTRATNLEGATNGLRTDVLNLQGGTNGLRTDVLNLQGSTNGLNTGLAPWSNLTTNKVVTTNDQWLITRGSNGVVVAAGAGISVASSGASGQQTFTVTATGGGGGGGGGPGSLPMDTTQFDTNGNATVKTGAKFTNTVNRWLTLTDAGAPPLPDTNTMTIGKDSYAGRGMLEWWDDNGLSIAAQPWFGNNRITMFLPSATTVIGSLGITTPVNLGGVTVSHPPPTEEWPYMVQLATPATSNACAGTFSSIDMTTMGTRYGHNGYFFATEFLTTNRLNQHTLTAPAGNRLFIGRTSTANPNLTNIVNTTNGTGQYVGLYVDSGHTNQFYLTARDGTAEFRTNTGMLWVATNLYQFYMMQAPTSRMLAWKLKDLKSNTVAQGWFSNNVPTNMMKFGYLIRNGTTVVNSVRFSKIYVEAPLSP